MGQQPFNLEQMPRGSKGPIPGSQNSVYQRSARPPVGATRMPIRVTNSNGSPYENTDWGLDDFRAHAQSLNLPMLTGGSNQTPNAPVGGNGQGMMPGRGGGYPGIGGGNRHLPTPVGPFSPVNPGIGGGRPGMLPPMYGFGNPGIGGGYPGMMPPMYGGGNLGMGGGYGPMIGRGGYPGMIGRGGYPGMGGGYGQGQMQLPFGPGMGNHWNRGQAPVPIFNPGGYPRMSPPPTAGQPGNWY